MRKCAKCSDFLDGHTCHSCALRHQCEIESCSCHQFPNLPHCIGSDYQGYSNRGSKFTLPHYAKHYGVNLWDNRRSSLRYKGKKNRRVQEVKALRAEEHEERTIHG